MSAVKRFVSPVLIFLSFFCFNTVHVVANVGTKVDQEERPIVLVITSYNNSKWYKHNLNSVFAQNYSNYRIIYVDDCSPDGTAKLVEQYIRERGQEQKCTLVKNTTHKFKLENFYNAVHQYCDDGDIVLDFDGDDFLAHKNVLRVINEAYADQEVWLTYGSYANWPKPTRCCCRAFPQRVVDQGVYRDHEWITSHLKTFYAWLFKKIDVQDFKYGEKYLDMTGDMAFMFPMLEMSGGRFKFIAEVLYLYNRANPINDDKKNKARQLFFDKFLRKKTRYNSLARSPLGVE